MTLPHDISRCEGTRAKLCQTCRRREPGGKPQWYIVPHVDRSGRCPDYIATIAQEGADHE